jgi:hypothetical protein
MSERTKDGGGVSRMNERDLGPDGYRYGHTLAECHDALCPHQRLLGYAPTWVRRARSAALPMKEYR